MKISVYKSMQVLVVAQHYFELERFKFQVFNDQNNAADYIEKLADEV